MTNLERMRLRTNEPNDAVLLDCLESAKSAILARRYPYSTWPTQEIEVVVPPVTGTDPDTGETIVVTPGHTETQTVYTLEARYLDLQYRIALSIYLKRGGDYEVSHTENNVSRSWASEGIPEELLNEIVPMVSIIN